ncbi:MAG: hypothetical protein IID63_08520 [candidate division Zixibacteria bacterium]|nr:hypothetical protein [candidate division Zixibacteria bacterium]
MIQLIIGSLLLSVVHAAIPNHWIPLVALGRTENWSKKETLVITAITGFAHTASTIIIGVFVGFLGYELSTRYFSIISVVAPAILIGLGIIYVIADFYGGHHHHHAHIKQSDNSLNISKVSIVASLCVAMFFSPCIEIEVYYFNAGIMGWSGIWIVSAIYLVVTVLGMVLLVDLGLRGAKKIRSHFLDHHEKLITGIVLIVLGIGAYFIEI